MSTSSISRFDSLPARPPTPPREIAKAIDDAISFLDDSNEIEHLTNKSAQDQRILNASEVTPSSSQDTTSFSNLTKKVGFSPNPVYYKVSRPDQSSSPGAKLLKRSPSTTKDAKPLKSILKLSYAPPPTPEDLETKLNYFSPEVPGSFAKMLQGICQQLANPSWSIRLDAYMSLNGALQQYEHLPDATAMAQKMDLLMRFLSRDIPWKDSADTMETQIANQALKLTFAILHSPEASDALDDDFRHFLVDRSITVLEQSNVPKQIFKSHMYLLSQQRFRAPIMNSGRVDRLLTALQSIEDKCSGNSVVSCRLMIYERLLEQAAPAMLSRTREWLEHIFHGMLSSIKDLRSRAIETGTKASLNLGQQAHTSLVLCEMFETEVEQSEAEKPLTYLDYVKSRLLQMISDKETGFQVPQIWSTVILFFRSKRRPLDRWPSLQKWLEIIGKCFNSSDLSVRHQATLAWNKMVFTSMPGSSTSKGHMSMLRVPLMTALERRSKDKSTMQYRQFVLESFYNLLHYGLRPGLSAEELDKAWDEFVHPILSGLVRAKGKGRSVVCKVLQGFLDGNVGVWNANAAFQSAPIKPRDLPKLEPKWVRTRLQRFLKLIEPILFQDMWSSDDDGRAVEATWHSLMHALEEARSQEVKTNMELKESIALLVALFRRIWSGCTTPVDRHRWLERYISSLDAMMSAIGTSAFTEDILTTTSDNIIEVAPTPSHRGSKHHGPPTSPLVILLGQFYQIPSGLAAGDAYFSAALSILEPAVSSRGGSGATLDLLYRCLHTWMDSYGPHTESLIQREMWIVVTRVAVQTLQAESQRSNVGPVQPMGHALRSAAEIFTRGLQFEPHPRLSNALLELYTAMSDSAKSCAKEGGIVLAVMEPLAKAVIDAGSKMHFDTKLAVSTPMLSKVTWPKNRQSVEQARKSLWGVDLTPVKQTVFDPFEYVYELIVDDLREAYGAFREWPGPGLDSLSVLVDSVLTFLKGAPVSVLATALRKLQGGLTVWIEDSERKTATNQQVAELMRTGWETILRLLNQIPSKDSTLLKALEPLLVAGFASPHRTIVNSTIVFWNDTFGSATTLDYPKKLECVLRARLADAEMALPNFPEIATEQVPATLPTFYDSESPKDTTLHPPKVWAATGASLLSPSIKAHRPQSSLGIAKSSPVTRNVASPSPATAHKRSVSLTPKPRLRHDDSQIQFAPIDSSPLPPAEESQLLTEHQKEVKARQHLSAQLFPDLSSSPMAHSTTVNRGLPKRLDFGAKIDPERANDNLGTPSGLPDGNVLASDDMPSSPTPSSTKAASQSAINVDMDQDEDDEGLRDPPSSPPRAADEDYDQEAAVSASKEDEKHEGIKLGPSCLPELHVDAGISEGMGQTSPRSVCDKLAEEDEMFSASEYPSNSTLPDEQLQLETEMAYNTQQAQSDTAVGGQFLVGERNEPNDDGQKTTITGTEDEVSRVDDSFTRPASQNSSPSKSNDESDLKASRKRKRKESKEKAAKKRKPQSPIQRVWSTFGFGQQDDDDDIGEDIVVASSQPVPSPTTQRTLATTDKIDEPEQDEVIIERSVVVVKEEPGMIPKRGRGRPRKSETPNPSRPEIAPPKGLKRKASQISNASPEDSQTPESFVKDTPAPVKHKRPGRPKQNKSSQESQEHPRPGSSSGQAAVAVVVSPAADRVRIQQMSQEQRAVHGEAEEDAATLASDRPIHTPRSILARLKGALSDFRGMILGSQEEKEFDDVLFELRREAHEAGRRGRDS